MTQISTRPVPSPLTPADHRSLMSCWSTGVAVVTSVAGGEPVGCTVNAITSISLEPPLLLVALAARSRTLAAIQEQRRLGVNLLPSQRSDLARRFCQSDPADRFVGVEYEWAVDVPMLTDVVASAVCRIERCVPVADHVLVLAEPLSWVRSVRRSPLVCYDRAYWSLWSIAKIGDW